MFVTVTEEDLSTVIDHATVVEVTGSDEDGSPVTFAGDARPMEAFLDAVLAQGEATADVEDWQILRSTR